MSSGLGFLRCSSVARSIYVEVCTHGEKMKEDARRDYPASHLEVKIRHKEFI